MDDFEDLGGSVHINMDNAKYIKECEDHWKVEWLDGEKTLFDKDEIEKSGGPKTDPEIEKKMAEMLKQRREDSDEEEVTQDDDESDESSDGESVADRLSEMIDSSGDESILDRLSDKIDIDDPLLYEFMEELRSEPDEDKTDFQRDKEYYKNLDLENMNFAGPEDMRGKHPEYDPPEHQGKRPSERKSVMKKMAEELKKTLQLHLNGKPISADYLEKIVDEWLEDKLKQIEERGLR